MDKLKVAVLAGDIWDEFNRFYDDAKKLTKLFKEWRRLTLEADNGTN